MSLLWRDAVRYAPRPHEELMARVGNWPDKVHVTQAGFKNQMNSPIIRSFLKNRGNQDAAWYRTEDVDLHQPIFSWQREIVKKHLLKYLDNPAAVSEKVKRDKFSDGYAGDEHPCAIRHMGVLTNTDGNHRVAAEMLRGTTPHMKMWVYDADKHGFPHSIRQDPPSDYPPPVKYDFGGHHGGWDWLHHGPSEPIRHRGPQGLGVGDPDRDWWHHPLAGTYYKDDLGSFSGHGSWGSEDIFSHEHHRNPGMTYHHHDYDSLDDLLDKHFQGWRERAKANPPAHTPDFSHPHDDVWGHHDDVPWSSHDIMAHPDYDEKWD